MRLSPLVVAVVLFGVAVVTTGCAPTSSFPTIDPALAEAEAERQRIETLRTQFRRTERLLNVSDPILANNVALCGDRVAYRLGLLAYAASDFGGEWRRTAEREFGLGDRISIVSISRGSPAEAAGLALGDRIVSADGVDVGTGTKAHGELRSVIRRYEGGAITLRVLRGGSEVVLPVVPALVCDYPVIVSQVVGINAWADGKNILRQQRHAPLRRD